MSLPRNLKCEMARFRKVPHVLVDIAITEHIKNAYCSIKMMTNLLLLKFRFIFAVLFGGSVTLLPAGI